MTRRKLHMGLALAAGLIGVTMTIGALAPASAQSGSRICGNKWVGSAVAPDGTTKALRYYRYAEVPKNSGGGNLLYNAEAACSAMIDIMDRNAAAKDWAESLNGYSNITWESREPFRFMTCEDFGRVLEGRAGDDPCNSMNRVDTAFEADSAATYSNLIIH